MQDEWKLIYKPQDPTLNEQIIDTLYLTNIKEDIGEVVNYAEKSKDKVNELLQLRREFEAKNRR